MADIFLRTASDRIAAVILARTSGLKTKLGLDLPFEAALIFARVSIVGETLWGIFRPDKAAIRLASNDGSCRWRASLSRTACFNSGLLIVAVIFCLLASRNSGEEVAAKNFCRASGSFIHAVVIVAIFCL